MWWFAAAAAAAPGVHQEVLDNGLRVVLVEHHANPMVATAVAVGAGAVDERDGAWGASHFLEHLLFNGTERRTQQQLYDEVDRYGAYNNASTHADHTLFTLLVHRDYARQGLDIQADMLFHSTIPVDKFDKERGIVLEELARSENDPQNLAERAFAATAWAGTPLAHPVLGTPESLGALTREGVLAYYHERYVPANMTLFVTGDFETDAMMAAIRDTFGRAATGPVPPAASAPAIGDARGFEGPATEGRHVLIDVPLGIGPEDPRLMAVSLLVSAAGDGADAPLARALEDSAHPLVVAWSMGPQLRLAPWSTVSFEATLADGVDADAVVVEVLRALGDLGPGSAARDRLDDVRRAAVAEDALLRDRIHYVGPSRSWALLAPGEVHLDGGLASVDDAEVESAAALIGAALGHVRVGVLAPGLAEGPRALPAVPAPAPRSSGDATARTRLPSGAEVWFAQHPGSEVFGLHVAIHPAVALEPAGKAGIATVLHRMLLQGSVVRSGEALDREIRSLGAEVKTYDDPAIPFDDYYARPEYGYLRVQLPAASWRAAVDLLPEILLHPRFDPADLEAVKAEVLEVQRLQAGSPSKVAQRALLPLLAPGDPSSAALLGTPESVSSITVDDLRAFHRAYVTGAHLLVTATGPMDPDDFVAALGEALADLPPGEPAPAVAAADIGRGGGREDRALGKPQSQILLGTLLDVRPEDRAALTVAVEMLSSRLMFSLREEQGLAYSVGASAGPFAGRWLWSVSMGTRPENVDTALTGLRAGIVAFRKSKPTADDVLKTANALRGQSMMRRLTRVGTAYADGMAILEGRTPAEALAELDALPGVTPKAVAQAAKRYLDPDRLTVVVVK